MAKSIENEATDRISTDTLIDARTNRFKGKQGRTGKYVALAGVKGNEEEESEKKHSRGKGTATSTAGSKTKTERQFQLGRVSARDERLGA